MDRQNETLRTHALGGFAALLEAIIADPAMLVWLDGGTSKKDKPNENFAREFLELFTLGAGHYTERDIREAARAFTGWVRQDSRGGFQETPAFTHDPAQVDDGPKTFLGQTGRWGPSDIVRITLERPEAATFLARKLYRFFVSESGTPGPELIEPLAEEIQRHQFAIGPIVEVILRSRHFYSRAAYRQRIKSPVEFSAGLVRMLEVPRPALNPLALVGRLRRAGPGAVRPAERRGLGRRLDLDQQRHPAGTHQLGRRRRLGPLRERPDAVRPAGLGRALQAARRPRRRGVPRSAAPGRPRRRAAPARARRRPRRQPRRTPQGAPAPRQLPRVSTGLIGPIRHFPKEEIPMHPTRREMLRLGLGSSALLACGPTVPLFLARSANALADDRPAREGPHPGRGPARRRQRRSEHRGAVSRRRVPQAPAQAGDPGGRGEEDRRSRRPAPDRSSRSRSCSSSSGWRSCRAWATPTRTGRTSRAWRSGTRRRTTVDKAAPGWLARAIDRRAGPGRRCAGAAHPRAFPLPGALAGGRQVVPSMARLEQFRRRLGMPAGTEAAAQIEALDRLARQDRGEPGSLLQFVERCSLITYASSARLERVQQDQPRPPRPTTPSSTAWPGGSA